MNTNDNSPSGFEVFELLPRGFGIGVPRWQKGLRFIISFDSRTEAENWILSEGKVGKKYVILEVFTKMK
jgi:hypothetical protein